MGVQYIFSALRKIFVWFKQIIPLLNGQTTVCLIETNSQFDDFFFIQTNILFKTCKLLVWVIVCLTKFVWYKQIFCLKALKLFFWLLVVYPHFIDLNIDFV